MSFFLFVFVKEPNYVSFARVFFGTHIYAKYNEVLNVWRPTSNMALLFTTPGYSMKRKSNAKNLPRLT